MSYRSVTPIAKWIFICFAFILAAGLSAYFTVNLLVGSQDTVVVPDLGGRDVVYALEILSSLGLNTKVEGVEFNPNIPKNHVILQQPEPGSEIKKGRDIRLILSKGPSTVVVPRLLAMPVIKARIILEQNGLGIGKIAKVYDCDSPKGTILSQFPAPSTKVHRGRKLDLLVSQGHEPLMTTMIDVTGIDLAKAMIDLDAAHLSLGTVKIAFKAGQEEATVIRQTPSAGYPVALATAVDLVVNRREITTGQSDRPSIGLFRYQAPIGFLNQHVKVVLSRTGSTTTIFDGYLKPGRILWLLIDRGQPATLSLYVDGKLTSMEFYD